MCDCIQRYDDKLQPYGLQLMLAPLADTATGEITDERLMIAMERIATQRPVKYGKVTLVAIYCPFCSKPYGEPDAQAGAASEEQAP